MDREFARLKWHCRRGMRELDVLLERYLCERYPDADPREQAAFRALLEYQDPVLHRFLMGQSTPPEKDLADVVRQITATHRH